MCKCNMQRSGAICNLEMFKPFYFTPFIQFIQLRIISIKLYTGRNKHLN